jgi:hypothetical protein
LGGIILLLCSIVLSVAVTEGLLQLFPGVLPMEVQKQLEAHPKVMGIGHPYIGHLHTPNSTGILWGSDFKATHHTDNYGFRNRWPWPAQAEIVAVGDSLTFGYGVEDDEAWPAIIAQALPQLRLVNLGLIGASPEQYRRVYETFGIPLRPKVLLVGLFVGNDFWDAALFDRWWQSAVGGNYMVWRDFGRGETGLKSLVSRNSYLYHLLRHAFTVYKNWRWRVSESVIYRFADGTWLHLLPSQLASFTTGAQPNRPAFQLVLQALERIQSIANENGTHVLFIFQPSKEEVYLPLLGKPASDPGGPLRVTLDRRGIAYLDLVPAFRRRAMAGEQLFFEQDGHPNKQGYQLIAYEVLAYLQNKAVKYDLEEIIASSSPPEKRNRE